jgi:C-22 sterol desaturase
VKLSSTVMDSSMAAEIANASSNQPELLQIWPFNTSQLQSALPGFLAGWFTWKYIVTFLLGVVVYDQGN